MRITEKSIEKLGYIPSFDGLRAYAVFFVMLAHANFQLGENGGLGVDIFFTLSGFLITRKLLEEAENFGQISFKSFYLRRLFRLVPALLLLLAVLTPVIYAFNISHFSVYSEEVISTLLYLYNVSWYWGLADEPYILYHMWSLGVEEQFYLIIPGLISVYAVRYSQNRKILTICTILYFVFFGMKGFLLEYGLISSLFLDSIFIGFFLGLWTKFFDFKLIVSPIILGLTFLLLMFAAIFPMTIVYEITALGYRGVFGLISAVLIVNLVHFKERMPLHILFNTAFIRYIGRISYGIYLWHLPVFVLFSEFSPFEPAYSFMLKFVVSLIMAVLSFELLEKPILRFSRRNFSRQDVKTAL